MASGAVKFHDGEYDGKDKYLHFSKGLGPSRYLRVQVPQKHKPVLELLITMPKPQVPTYWVLGPPGVDPTLRPFRSNFDLSAATAASALQIQ